MPNIFQSGPAGKKNPEPKKSTRGFPFFILKIQPNQCGHATGGVHNSGRSSDSLPLLATFPFIQSLDRTVVEKNAKRVALIKKESRDHSGGPVPF